jgi:hypothetical protein
MNRHFSLLTDNSTGLPSNVKIFPLGHHRSRTTRKTKPMKYHRFGQDRDEISFVGRATRAPTPVTVQQGRAVTVLPSVLAGGCIVRETVNSPFRQKGYRASWTKSSYFYTQLPFSYFLNSWIINSPSTLNLLCEKIMGDFEIRVWYNYRWVG